MTLLSETAHELTHQHKRRVVTDDGPVWGDEPALLDILEKCVTNPSSNGGAGGGGDSTRAGLPINADALVLWEGIQKAIDRNWPGRGNPAYVRVRAVDKLNAWVNTTLDPVDEAALLVWCRRWAAQIRELLEPTKVLKLPGVACKVCGWDRTVTEEDGEFTYRPALVAYPESVPPVVVCTVESCGAQWSGPEIADAFMQTLVTGRATV